MADVARKRTAFGIDENRVSFALLFLLIAAGASYGLWQVVQPLVQSAKTETEVPRRLLADELAKEREYDQAAELYMQILKDDPLNGYVTAKLALTHENKMRDFRADEKMIYDKTENEEDLPADELKQLDMQINQHLLKAANEYAKLKDHLRFRGWGTARRVMACSMLAKRNKDDQYAQQAIDIVRDAIEGDYSWPRMFTWTEVDYLKNYPEYRQLLKKHNIPLNPVPRVRFP